MTASEGGKPIAIAAVAIDAQARKYERIGIRHLLQLPNGREIIELALTFSLITRAPINDKQFGEIDSMHNSELLAGESLLPRAMDGRVVLRIRIRLHCSISCADDAGLADAGNARPRRLAPGMEWMALFHPGLARLLPDDKYER